MKTTIKFFATFLTFIFLATIVQAQTPKGGTGGKRTSARIPVLKKQAAEQKSLEGLEMNGRFKKLQKQAAKEKALKEGKEFLANKRKAALQKQAAKEKAIKEAIEMNGRFKKLHKHAAKEKAPKISRARKW